MDNDESKTPEPQDSKWAKFGPVIFWGTIIAMPAMNLTAAIFNYKSLKLQYEIERIKELAERVQ